MILDTTSKTIEVILAAVVATNQLEINADFTDTMSGTTFAPQSLPNITNSTTAVTAVPAPAANTQRHVKSLSVYNADTVAATVTVRTYDGTNRRRKITATLGSGELLFYEAGAGWRVLDANGNLKAAAVYTRGQIIGTNTNDNASAGNVGEYLSATTSTATNINTATATNIGNIALTAGDWDVRIWCEYKLGTGTVNWTRALTGVSTTSATLDTSLGRVIEVPGASVSAATSNMSVNLAGVRWSEASTQTLYGIAYVEYTGGGQAQFIGNITARRVR